MSYTTQQVEEAKIQLDKLPVTAYSDDPVWNEIEHNFRIVIGAENNLKELAARWKGYLMAHNMRMIVENRITKIVNDINDPEELVGVFEVDSLFRNIRQHPFKIVRQRLDTLLQLQIKAITSAKELLKLNLGYAPVEIKEVHKQQLCKLVSEIPDDDTNAVLELLLFIAESVLSSTHHSSDWRYIICDKARAYLT